MAPSLFRLIVGILTILVGSGSLVAGDLRSASSAPGTANWALVINGDDSFTHRRNVEVALEALTGIGFGPERILALTVDPVPRPVDWAPATERHVRRAFERLSHELRAGDSLLVYLTGHGDRVLGRVVLQLEDGTLSARRLARSLAKLPEVETVLVADQCFSGGFADELARIGRPVTAVTSTDAFHETRCEPFIRPFWRAFSEPSNDLDGDGEVSYQEAFCRAEEVSGKRFDDGRGARIVALGPPSVATAGRSVGPCASRR